MKSLFTLAALFALAVPAAFAAPPASPGASAAPPSSGPTPSQLCREQLRVMGAASFISTYAPGGNGRSALGRCISRQAALASSNQTNAAKECKKERGTTSASIAAFNATYGTNENDRNAYGKCVSKKARELNAAQQDATLNAAKTCKAERASIGAVAFKNKYGTNPSKSNAFGKCIQKNK